MSTTQISAEDADVGAPTAKVRRARGGRNGRVAAVVVVVAAAVVAGIIITDPFGPGTSNTTISSGAQTGLAKVTKGTLSSRTLENGKLGFGGDYPVVNKASGTITQIPSVGQTIKQGKVFYKVDGKPVILLQGAYVPVYRALTQGTRGVDVRQLNTALVALGYADKDDLDPDSNYFSWQTYYALEKLQDKVGMKENGELALGQLVFMPAKELRITKAIAVRGGPAAVGTAILQASSTERQVTVALNASQQSTVAVGNKVTITLPNGRTTPGVVSAVGKVATKSDTKTTIDVYIRPLNPKATGQLDQAPVQVSIISDTAKDVLKVPVNSLLALAGGGYAVEVVDPGGAHRLIAVKTGLFDDSEGTVEVTGSGLTPGQDIVVPKS